jgi:hypothetical protein
MKYAVEMFSGTMMCTPSFMKIGSGTKKLIVGIHRHKHTGTQTAWRSHKPALGK